ncbi:glycosyltransferase family 2 protein [Sesbania bispinosa]|nr:glycosyltransferase family 2 protein [Sesbania bispinosa]
MENGWNSPRPLSGSPSSPRPFVSTRLSPYGVMSEVSYPPCPSCLPVASRETMMNQGLMVDEKSFTISPRCAPNVLIKKYRATLRGS